MGLSPQDKTRGSNGAGLGSRTPNTIEDNGGGPAIKPSVITPVARSSIINNLILGGHKKNISWGGLSCSQSTLHKRKGRRVNRHKSYLMSEGGGSIGTKAIFQQNDA